MSDFLEKLKNAVENEEFNSEAAKKILEINKLAESKIGNGTEADIEKLKESLMKREASSEESKESKAVSEEEALELNSKYEEKMKALKDEERKNKEIADHENMVHQQLITLMDIEAMVKASIGDMFEFADGLESRFDEEFEAKDPRFVDLILKIKEIKSKYKPIIK